ncbi:MAG: DUF58 domain-containing protein [Gammaproteobacteria bacterium]|jgi:uncharacterized protein (DUF58 family)
MSGTAEKIAGIEVDVGDLIGVRGQLAGLPLAAMRRRASYRSGARDTRVRGRGMEYEESRAYIPGDDVRTMDWRVMARTGDAHTKIFAEEKERRFLLAVDLSPSMYFGTRLGFKSWAAAHTAAHVGWLASFSGDRIGGLVVAPDFHREVRPGKTRAGLLGVFHHLAAASRIQASATHGGNRLNFLLRELQRVVKPGAIIALISDFIGLDDDSMETLSTLVRHNDINAYWISDDTETRAWPGGHYEVFSDERKIGFDLAGAGRDDWLAGRLERHRQRVENLASRFRLPLMEISCNRETGPQILRHLNL